MLTAPFLKPIHTTTSVPSITFRAALTEADDVYISPRHWQLFSTFSFSSSYGRRPNEHFRVTTGLLSVQRPENLKLILQLDIKQHWLSENSFWVTAIGYWNCAILTLPPKPQPGVLTYANLKERHGNELIQLASFPSFFRTPPLTAVPCIMVLRWHPRHNFLNCCAFSSWVS